MTVASYSLIIKERFVSMGTRQRRKNSNFGNASEQCRHEFISDAKQWNGISSWRHNSSMVALTRSSQPQHISRMDETIHKDARIHEIITFLVEKIIWNRTISHDKFIRPTNTHQPVRMFWALHLKWHRKVGWTIIRQLFYEIINSSNSNSLAYFDETRHPTESCLSMVKRSSRWSDGSARQEFIIITWSSCELARDVSLVTLKLRWMGDRLVNRTASILNYDAVWTNS